MDEIGSAQCSADIDISGVDFSNYVTQCDSVHNEIITDV
jgi:hypothetical protein